MKRCTLMTHKKEKTLNVVELMMSQRESRLMVKNLQERRRIGAGVGDRSRVSLQQLTSPEEQLSPENETLERRNLKSILKKLSAANSRASVDAASALSSSSLQQQPSSSSCTVVRLRPGGTATEMRKLMRAPTLEGYAARHSKLSKSVTFNKYTLQSPPGNDHRAETTTTTTATPGESGSVVTSPTTQQQPQPSTSVALVREPSAESAQDDREPPQQQLEEQQALEQQPLPPLPSNKVTAFRPLGSGAVIAASQLLRRPMRQDECIDELVTDIRDAVQVRLVSIAFLSIFRFLDTEDFLYEELFLGKRIFEKDEEPFFKIFI